ncbi:hypothetical protein, partial [Escherichia coli]|uniref:hypothetical protein n=1 Tax=Escherichia coli TaxID=562 RepID=UPI00273805C8
MLEDREFQWELVNSWTTYLFSDGPEGYESQRRNEVAVSQAQSILDETIKKAINEEISCRINEERRLVVRNIAAAATGE